MEYVIDYIDCSSVCGVYLEVGDNFGALHGVEPSVIQCI